MKRLVSTPSLRRDQRGFTLLEMMVAVTIGMVVILGVTVTFVNMKASWGTQDKMAQLQDNERLAMAFLTSSVEEAGYYPDPTSAAPFTGYTDATYGSSTYAGQVIMGTAVSGSTSATLTTRYGTVDGDGILTCQGSTNTSGSAAIIRNVFYVDATAKTLNCIAYANESTTTAPGAVGAALVTGVASMDVLYAVDTDDTGTAYKYLPASSMTATYWQNVRAVRVTLNFVNPNASLSGAPATIAWVQTINLMNNQ